jgi:SagB-type dehydrogenase family enzyme
VADGQVGYGAEQIAGYGNAYQLVASWVTSTGFRTPGLRFKDLGGASRRGVAEEFLLATRYRRADREVEASIQGYFLDPGVVMLSRNGEEDIAGRATVPLPPGVRLTRELGEVVATRRSVRGYTGDAVPLDQVATLVRAAGAITGVGHVDLLEGGTRDIQFRTAPSPGGLYPIELWLLARGVDGLARGVWRYDPRRDLLVDEGDEARLDRALAAFAVPEEIISLSRAALVVLMIGRPWKVLRKYGDRGARYLFIEAGATAENLHLACGSLGLGSVDCASVHDDELHAALDLDGELRLLVHTVVVGTAS